MLRFSHDWVLLLSLILLSSQAVAQCFLPNGTDRNSLPGVEKGDYLPCDNNAKVSMCCALGRKQDPDSCLSNGLCKSKDDSVYWRESCTDRKWGPACLQLFVTGFGGYWPWHFDLLLNRFQALTTTFRSRYVTTAVGVPEQMIWAGNVVKTGLDYSF